VDTQNSRLCWRNLLVQCSRPPTFAPSPRTWGCDKGNRSRGGFSSRILANPAARNPTGRRPSLSIKIDVRQLGATPAARRHMRDNRQHPPQQIAIT